jgi:hypothetical protein
MVFPKFYKMCDKQQAFSLCHLEFLPLSEVKWKVDEALKDQEK